MKKKHILVINSATSVLQVGITANEADLAVKENTDRFRHAEFIFPLIDGLCREAGLPRPVIEAIIVSIGPGSFTGLRVGLASAKGLALSLGIPLVGVSLFESIASRLFQAFGKTRVYIPSRRNEYYTALIDSSDFDNRTITVVTGKNPAPLLANTKHLAIDCTPGPEMIGNLDFLDSRDFSLGLDDFLRAGIRKLDCAGGDDIAVLEPLYIQQFPAHIKK
nr:tRNA (adenosine(37)-N6)-threonylcarbamoyltransferase complex dimerization subunit type 1 TsaB [candidate division Zixibacteria bacterium]